MNRPDLAVHPSISLVICTAGRRDSLRRLFANLRCQGYRPLEVVVVVGPSSDETLSYVQSLGEVKVRTVDALNLSLARNVGIRAASGDIIAFIDDDAIPADDWLDQIADSFTREGADCGAVGGATILATDSSLPLQFRNGRVGEMGNVECVRLEPQECRKGTDRWFPFLHGTNMAFRREALESIGGFDEGFEYQHDETDVCVRLIKAGFRVVSHPRAFVSHYPAGSHNRKSRYDVNYFAILRSYMYFAMKHSRRSLARCVLSMIQQFGFYGKRFLVWLILGKIGWRDCLRYYREWLRGISTGARLGLRFRSAVEARTNLRAAPPGEFLDLPSERRPMASPRRPPASLRIGLVCRDFGSDCAGGIGVYTKHLAEGFASRGHAVTVFRPGNALRNCDLDGYKVVGVSEHSGPRQIALYDAIRDFAREKPLDIVEAPLWGGDASAIGMFGPWPLVLRLETPFEVVRQICGFNLDRDTRRAVAVERLQLSYASGVIAISQAVAHTVESVYDCSLPTLARQAAVIPLGLPDVDSIPITPIDLEPCDGPNLLFVGRLEARKGILDLAEAFREFSNCNPRASLWIVGADNSLHDGFHAAHGSNYISEIHRLCGPNASQRIRFFGSLSEGAKNFLYSRCDVFVAPSRYESFGLVLLEAMRFAKPVIACEVGGIPEIVVNGKTGILVPPESPRRLATAMAALADDVALRKAFGESGRGRFLAEFSVSRCVERSLEFYAAVLERFRGSASRLASRPNHLPLQRASA